MISYCARPLWIASLFLTLSVGPAWGDGLLDGMKAGKHKHTRDWHLFPRKHEADEPICDITDLANKLDIIEEGVRDDGIIGIKTPDVWGQARMTLYRRQFEEQMAGDLGSFAPVLSGRIARLDAASFENTFSLGLALQGAKGGTGSDITTQASEPSTDSEAEKVPIPEVTGYETEIPSSDDLLGSRKDRVSEKIPAGIGIEPTVYLDQKKRYLDHLNQLRRVNMGDDLADAAGYGLYLIRFPVSIQPGEKTFEGHGAEISLTVRPEVSTGFVVETFKQLVIEDVVDDLTPMLLQMLRSEYEASATVRVCSKEVPPTSAASSAENVICKVSYNEASSLAAQPQGQQKLFSVPVAISITSPTDLDRLYGEENIEQLKQKYLIKRDLVDVRYADVNNFLRAELKRMSLCCLPPLRNAPSEAFCFLSKVETLQSSIESCQYKQLAKDLKGVDSCGKSVEGEFDRALARVLAVGMARLNLQLRTDIARQLYDGDYSANVSLANAQFYHPNLDDPTAELFEEYIQKRWPIVAFAIDPVVDQQNIDDSMTYRRDLQLATAFALATGKMSLNNASKFTRALQEDAETIALNRTVTSFAFGNETFGWRFYPRFQVAPNERTNAKVLVDMLVRGGRGRDYRIKNARLEPGQRELTAVIVMPSFLRKVHFQVAGNWFKLNQPDDLRITTARQLEQGRLVQQLQSVCAEAHNNGCYRQEDIEGVDARIRRLESMLPMQTYTVSVPYENLLSGQELFVPGSSALSPRLFGYEGADKVMGGKECDLILYGKHFSIGETVVLAGGCQVPADKFCVVSRNILKVTIPEGVLPTQVANYQSAGGRYMVEVSVSTSNGISNRIYIPYEAESLPTAATGPTVSMTPEIICYQAETCRFNGKCKTELKLTGVCSMIQFRPDQSCDVLPQTVDVKCNGFPGWEAKGQLDPEQRCYRIPADELMRQALDSQGGTVDACNPAKPMEIGPFVITADHLTCLNFKCRSVNKIQVVFQQVPCAGPGVSQLSAGATESTDLATESPVIEGSNDGESPSHAEKPIISEEETSPE